MRCGAAQLLCGDDRDDDKTQCLDVPCLLCPLFSRKLLAMAHLLIVYHHARRARRSSWLVRYLQ